MHVRSNQVLITYCVNFVKNFLYTKEAGWIGDNVNFLCILHSFSDVSYVTYTITLNAMIDGSTILTDTVTVMPTDIFIYLPVVLKVVS